MQFPQQVIAELIVSYSSSQGGGPAVQIGPGAEIVMYNTAGQVVGAWTPQQFFVINPANGAEIAIYPEDFTDNLWPTIYFKTSSTSEVAFINATPDASGNPVLGLNSTPYTDPGSGQTVYERLYMYDDAMNMQIVVESSQANLYGIELTHAGIFANGVPVFKGGATWTLVPLSNGWTAFGSPYQALQAIAMPDGTTRLRGTIHGGTKTANTLLGTIPTTDSAGNRLAPTVGAMEMIYNATGDMSTQPAVNIDIFNNGQITLSSAGTTSNDLSFDGITFPAYF